MLGTLIRIAGVCHRPGTGIPSSAIWMEAKYPDMLEVLVNIGRYQYFYKTRGVVFIYSLTWSIHVSLLVGGYLSCPHCHGYHHLAA